MQLVNHNLKQKKFHLFYYLYFPFKMRPQSLLPFLHRL
jgi:hypothetical protein